MERELERARVSNQRMAEAAQGASNRAHQEEVAALREEMARMESKLEERDARIGALNTSKEQLQQEVQMKVDLLELAGMEKEEARARLRSSEEELSRYKNMQTSQDKVIKSL